ncbi:ATP-dependent RecD-like DNA helicase [Xanthomonas campestris pv. spermacoces]|uniref:ATP-dependent DNA helicase n=1 Tax=Xanthomonas euvesicatoria TaxID=456327 RepID=UPI001C458DED|nr:ATP-dependent RecD-like DNA helicase [Xanthomonas euvesicatoria]MBV6887003.1 ATP-dependent RecD-like DNA helicase [Xanthomonas campestris pv. spermacoces]
MATVAEQIRSTSAAICQNIDSLAAQRPLLSQNVLAQLRNLVEGVVVRLHLGTNDAEFSFDATKPALSYVRSKGKLNFLARFHRLLQTSSSHYTLDGDASERLMLKYYEYMHRLRALVRNACAMEVLENLESFPLDLDPSLREYHQKISERIEATKGTRLDRESGARYYIHKIRPFFIEWSIYYEVTFSRAVDRASKFDRVIAFTDIDLSDKYSAYLVLHRDAIRVLDQDMPITLIRAWDVSIRPCELTNFGKVLGIRNQVLGTTAEFRHLNQWLTVTSGSLLDLMEMSEEAYRAARFVPRTADTRLAIFPILDEGRRIIRGRLPGHNLLRYLMLRLRNSVIRAQYSTEPCSRLSNLNVEFGCIPFETMPLCTSLRGHNPRFSDLVDALEIADRRHEMLARRLHINVEQHGMLYTPAEDLSSFGDTTELIANFNSKLYPKHRHRLLEKDKNHIFIRGYEDETASIVEELQRIAIEGIAGYSLAVKKWLQQAPPQVDDPVKKDALERLFADSKVALVYGAAGTGKSTMVDHIANYFNEKTKLFLAHTNPAIDNLKRKVSAQHATFRTISQHIYRNRSDPEYDLLVVDECSTVSNADLLKVLRKTSFKLLVLVGDVYQIESIQFGNWFSIIRSFLPRSAIFELTTPFRTRSQALLRLWDKVRNIEDDIDEVIAKNGYSAVLDKRLFERAGNDEIILCLNYDGLYGINNVNRFLQGANPNPGVIWREATYKVGDPILFNESERFRAILYNNLKGRIVEIQQGLESLRFDVQIERPLDAFDVAGTELEWVADSTVRFFVTDCDTSDDDDDEPNNVVPFQVAYAVSIHKAQGLEYDSVKVVVTDTNEENLTHSIFYTAITRARQHLRIFWTPETQRKVLQNLQRTVNPKDVALLAARRSFTPIR